MEKKLTKSGWGGRGRRGDWSVGALKANLRSTDLIRRAAGVDTTILYGEGRAGSGVSGRAICSESGGWGVDRDTGVSRNASLRR